ncbi:hypothetical protein R5H32_15055 [Defluviimonas sp. D31]|uniref:hypothetical protein n=1 Tax=Defluviimonas sp. D31 TaxID=3083253 RepID=UPI0029700923|nr:hypothetical protein [Defluviimonas sp. D31]MDW4550679.1 hypothetical protein [Defluviimonas sp. D31]
MEYLMSIDSIVSLISGAIMGGLASMFAKGFGLVGNIAAGLAGGLAGGMVFDTLDFMNVGDLADPAIAGFAGSALTMAVVTAIRRAP